jgi:hypothetical protein
MAKNYIQGRYKIKNREKYIGDPDNCIYRSSWEKMVCIHLDTDPSVIRWGSEEVIVRYISPIDNKVHRYFPDFFMEYVTKDGKKKKALIEVKPYKQTIKPTGKRMTKYLMEEYKTYAVNQAKWHAAKEFCLDRGMEFKVMTEKELNI